MLSISRSSFYYAPQGERALNLELMRTVDRQFLDTLFYGVRQMTWHLQNEGYAVNEKRASLTPDAPYAVDAGSTRNPIPASLPKGTRHILPLSARWVGDDWPNQVWCADITYIPMRKRLPLSRRHHGLVHSYPPGFSLTPRITLEAEQCVDALNEAIHKFGCPEIMNTDQGSQFYVLRLDRLG
ncbi:MAG: hypothetical protein U5N55_12130 [Cypionkella sp.]|nr:hypothetical protein [Cypionkella sp.]